jgi:hypothetical protein
MSTPDNSLRAQEAAAALRKRLAASRHEPIGQRARDIKPEHVTWLWPGRLAVGKVSVIDGDPGLGKSTQTLDIAARISSGAPLPGSVTATHPRGVVILSAEDGAADTIVPRLNASRADLNRVFIMTGVRALEGADDAVALPRDLAAVEQAITDIDAALLIVDPLMAYLGAETNAHRDQDVRRALAPMAMMLERTGCAGLLIRHLNKAQAGSALYRGGGSIGIIGAARFGLLVAKDPDDEGARILAPTKCNIGPHPPALRFRLEGVPGTDVAKVVWDNAPVAVDAAGLLAAAAGDDEERSALGEACDWLEQMLALGPRPVADVLRDARRDGHAERTVKRAKQRLGIQSSREGFGPGSHVRWFLPGRPPYDDLLIQRQGDSAPDPFTIGAVCEKPRNDEENDHSILDQMLISSQPQDDGPVYGVGAVWGSPNARQPNGHRVPVDIPADVSAYSRRERL